MRWLCFILFFAPEIIKAQYDNVYTMASSWSMWSAWSACAPEGVMIRVRACSTVRGFKCVGRNKEFKSCELQPPMKGDEDFDQADEDREMALRQLYQDYDLRGDAASLPVRPSAHLQHPLQRPAQPPGHDITVIAPPGHRQQVLPGHETQFRGDFKSNEEELQTQPTPIPLYPRPSQPNLPLARPAQRIELEQEEDLMEEEEIDDSALATTRKNPNFQTIQPLYTPQYVTQPPTTSETTTRTTTTPPTTTTTTTVTTTTIEEDDEEEVEVPLEEDESESEESAATPQSIEPLSKSFEFGEDTDVGEFGERVEPELVVPTTTEEPTSTEASTTTTTAPTTTSVMLIEPVPASSNILGEENPAMEETPIMVTPKVQYPRRFPKIHGRTMKQQLPTILGIHQPNALGMLPPASPPQIPIKIQHNGDIEALSIAKNQLQTLRKKKKLTRRLEKNRKQKVEEKYVTGDTARALNWLIANMTSSIGDETAPISDKVALEKYIPREQRRKQSKIRWSQWSIWSECQCGLQSRKRICIPSRSDVSLKCPLPQIEERECSSVACF